MRPASQDESLREATVADLDLLAALEQSAFDGPWSAAQLVSQLEQAQSLTLVAAGAVGELDAYATFTRVAGEAELLRIAVRPSARQRGLAKRLLRAALSRLAGDQIEICHLEVREDNGPALALYRSLGFEEVGRRKAYYPDQTAALLLRRSLLAAKP
ncbi:MAG: ribosomal protein S18-alanine N-acetyltransferase [Acidobacteriota bacterium]